MNQDSRISLYLRLMNFKTKIAKAEQHLSTNDPLMALAIKKYGPCKIKPHSDYYAELIDSIISQQLSVKAAATIQKRVMAVFGGKLPAPEQLLSADTEVLRACGVSYAKVAYMKDLAQHILEGRLDMVHISKLPNDELVEQLTAVKGIGVWSAHMFMIFSLGRMDVLPVGDLGIRKGAMLLYELPELPKNSQLETLSKKHQWHPYESVAAWYIWKSLEST
jgi:DNA-3-methyladenine glycosylase II